MVSTNSAPYPRSRQRHSTQRMCCAFWLAFMLTGASSYNKLAKLMTKGMSVLDTPLPRSLHRHSNSLACSSLENTLMTTGPLSLRTSTASYTQLCPRFTTDFLNSRLTSHYASSSPVVKLQTNAALKNSPMSSLPRHLQFTKTASAILEVNFKPCA